MMEIILETKSRIEVIDITEKVEKLVKDGKMALIFTPHTTAAIVLNEGERRLIEDLISALEKIFPRGAGYKHDEIDDNADSHLKACFLGNFALVPVSNGKLMLGTWQRILFVELDGPRRRKVFVQVI